jgi:hypothetical protein
LTEDHNGPSAYVAEESWHTMSNQLAWPEPANTVHSKNGATSGKYASLKVVADRWACDRSTVRRNLEAAGVKAFCLGHGKHGIVRYLLKDIEDYERRCREP